MNLYQYIILKALRNSVIAALLIIVSIFLVVHWPEGVLGVFAILSGFISARFLRPIELRGQKILRIVYGLLMLLLVWIGLAIFAEGSLSLILASVFTGSHVLFDDGRKVSRKPS